MPIKKTIIRIKNTANLTVKKVVDLKF